MSFLGAIKTVGVLDGWCSVGKAATAPEIDTRKDNIALICAFTIFLIGITCFIIWAILATKQND
jgi:hypothetical protein